MKYQDIFRGSIALLDAFGSLANASSILLQGGTVISFDEVTESVLVLQDTSVLIVDDRIQSLIPAGGQNATIPFGTEIISVEGKIVSPGFVDTHRHLWQSAFRTIASNTTLLEYFSRYGEYAASPQTHTPEDLYLSQTIGIWESLNAGVTSIVDHASGTWSKDHALAGINASIDSGARVWYCHTIHALPYYPISQQMDDYRAISADAAFMNTATSLGLSYDGWLSSSPEINEAFLQLVRETEPSLYTLHLVGGPWGVPNTPTLLHSHSLLNTSLPIIFSHGTQLETTDVNLLRSTNQYAAITPESEMHYGHGHPTSHLFQDVSALGVDTHFTYSADILTQARLWLQHVRGLWYAATLRDWVIPRTNPMSVEQAFLLATRNGGKAVRRSDVGVLVPGAKADVVVFDTSGPNLIGWADAVAAVMLHANVGDVEHVLVDGKWRKKDFRLLVGEREQSVRERFQESARRIQGLWAEMPLPQDSGVYPMTGGPTGDTRMADVVNGDGTGYAQSARS